jgi:nitrate/nitrite transporter NarK
LQGAPAIILGIYIFFVLPDRPKNASWLSDEEKQYLESRVTIRVESAQTTLKHLPEILKSKMAWFFAVIYFSMVIGFWSITYFLPQIIRERFHVDTIQAGFISAIPWAVAAVAIYVFAKTSASTGDRKWHMFSLLTTAGIGLLLSAATNSPVLALVGISLGAAGMQASVPLFWSMPSAAFTASMTAIAIAMINSLGNISGLAGPWVLGFFQDLTGSSRTGLYLMSGFFFLSAILAFTMSRHVSRSAQTLRH